MHNSVLVSLFLCLCLSLCFCFSFFIFVFVGSFACLFVVLPNRSALLMSEVHYNPIVIIVL